MQKTYWGNLFLEPWLFLSTVGVDEEKVKRYVKYQEDEGKKEDGSADLKLF